MSKDWFQDIVDFEDSVIGNFFIEHPLIPPSKYVQLRVTLIKEEVVEELLPAITEENLVKIADSICDSIVVLLGTAVTYGIDIRPIWDEVHRTNMLKKGGVLREDGKRLKPEGWAPPEVERLLKEQMKWS